MTFIHRNIGALLAAAIVCGSSSAVLAQDKQITMRFPVEYSIDVIPGQANLEFKKRIEEKSKGRIKVAIYADGSLYKGIDLIQAVIRGDAEMTTLVSAYWAAISPRISALDLPYAFPTHEAFYKAADDPELAKLAFSEMETKGVKVLAMLPYDYVVPGSREKALVNVTDFKDQKMRAIGKINSATLQSWGAVPVSINITEVGTSLQQGVINGLNTPIDVYVTYKWSDIIRNVNYAKYYFAFYPWTVSKKFWDGLTAEDQKMIQETAVAVAHDHRPRARKAADDSIAALKKAGVSVHIQTDAERQAWENASAGVWTKVEEQFGKDYIEKLRSFAK